MTNDMQRTVAHLGYGRHGTCHGHQFDGGAKIKICGLRFLQPLFCIPYNY